MSNLVVLKRQNKEEVPVTTSKLIAERTSNTHDAIQKILSKYESDFKEFGRVGFEIVPFKTKRSDFKSEQNELTDLKSEKSKRGRPEKIYYLNEQQATLLITYLRNSEIVRAFKVELVKQFYQMRQLLMQKATKEWQDARQLSKAYQKDLNDIINQFAIYAQSQGSRSPGRYFQHFSKLSNSIVGVKDGERDTATQRQLQTQTYVFDLIKRTLVDEMQVGIYYKEIYQHCKDKVSAMLVYMQPLSKGA